jgi:hypothetical protein
VKSALTVLILALFCQGAAAQTTTCYTYQTVPKVHTAGETAYIIGDPDQCAFLVFQNTGAETVTFPSPGTTFFPPGFGVDVYENGAGGLTLSPQTGTMNGTSSVSVAQGAPAVHCVNNGSSWWCM